MDRGYVKLWRKAQDSSSWTRGLAYQGLIVNLLMRAAWKESYYSGRLIQPGQFGVVLRQMAESLNIPRTTLVRMLTHLQEDGFLTVENVGNRFCIITIINWNIYQPSGQQEWITNGQPVVNQRITGGQPSYKEEERKNLRNINTHPLPLASEGSEDASPASSGSREEGTNPRAEGSNPRAQGENPRAKGENPRAQGSNPRKRKPTQYSAAFGAFWDRYPRKTGKDAAWKVWQRRSHELPGPDELAAILERQCHCEQWQRDGGQYIPHPATWLNQGRWKDGAETEQWTPKPANW